MHRGYIKIWRKLLDSFLCHDSEAFHLWIVLLLLANHEDKEFYWNGEKQICKRGQIVVGRKTLADKTKINMSKVYRILNMLENEHLIEQQKTNRYTLVSICCYDTYQENGQLTEQPLNNKRTTDEQQMNTNNTLIITNNTLIRTKKSNFSLDSIKNLKEKYPWVDMDIEFNKMDEWLRKHPDRQKNKAFITNWLNKVPKPEFSNDEERLKALTERIQNGNK